jgi:hypothetical protein
MKQAVVEGLKVVLQAALETILEKTTQNKGGK